MAPLAVCDYARIAEPERAFIERSFGSFSMLSQVLEWGRDLAPPVVVDEIITMDEYTHDVLVKLPNARYLAFDTT
jgi:hypothetical protein